MRLLLFIRRQHGHDVRRAVRFLSAEAAYDPCIHAVASQTNRDPKGKLAENHRQKCGDALEVCPVLHAAVADILARVPEVSERAFWCGLEDALAELKPRNLALLARRDELQLELDYYHENFCFKCEVNLDKIGFRMLLAYSNTHTQSDFKLSLLAQMASNTQPDPTHCKVSYTAFLDKVGYLEPPASEDFQVEVDGLDPEVASLAGPQLVFPADSSQHARDAVHSRWGSLGDAYRQTDALKPDGLRTDAEVVAALECTLDAIFTLTEDRKFHEVEGKTGRS